MVKIPGLDELKKMGSDLMDSAKSAKLVDKFKSGMESVGIKRGSTLPEGDEGIKNLFAEIYATLNELTEAQTQEANAVKKIKSQIGKLAEVIQALQNPPQATAEDEATESQKTEKPDTTNSEETKKP